MPRRGGILIAEIYRGKNLFVISLNKIYICAIKKATRFGPVWQKPENRLTFNLS